MIFGIGTDVVQLARVEAVYERHGEHFVSRLLLPEEDRAFRRYRRPVRFLAMRFAAKEAIVKALGTGFRAGIFWKDMGVVNLPSGKPTMALTGGALERLKAITPPGMIPQIDISITDEEEMAYVIVIISANPA